ncbi:M14 family zinc carboxypeptidase [Alteromonas sp. ASW11-36]|uniref:M14 family zinc carboxypeptidase n=1 Tax=Alteromonas arenosi TaxID=3055817 RepID=A0ABT7T138_9ALTE|nr:M14 family zinc carboxypeptidase [Alteromonas sp. ASW11-36]MDM7861524.1 M14 family zinc carboxypeptidase [Alteromonas sp. ASW11-36]
MDWIVHHYWPELDRKHVRRADIEPILEHFRSRPEINIQLLGHSVQQRPIELVSIGRGKQVVLAWTQMHGDEPTATAAVFDIIEQLLSDNRSLVTQVLNHFTLHFIPMLNPDGAERKTRENAQGIDINRDARKRCSPEAQILHNAVSKLRPDIAFNLHDQNRYYGVGNTDELSTIAFLAPPFDQEQSVNHARGRAMSLIAVMRQVLEARINGHVARYMDEYSPRCFGDTIAAMGASTLLIESGEFPNDPNRQTARAMNRLAIFTALDAVSQNTWQDVGEADYFAIPANNENHWGDIVLRNVTFAGNANSVEFQTDMLIRKVEGEYQVAEIGDLADQRGITELGCDQLTLSRGEPYRVSEPLTLDDLAYRAILKNGYSHFIDTNDNLAVRTELPVFSTTQPLPTTFHKLPAIGILSTAGSPRYAVLGRKVVELEGEP